MGPGRKYATRVALKTVVIKRMKNKGNFKYDLIGHYLIFLILIAPNVDIHFLDN